MTTRHATVCGLFLLLALATPPGTAMAEDGGDLQVTCWPGHRVYLDGRFAGLTTAEQDGLYLEAVPAGEHAVRIEKLGLQPRLYTVEVPSGGVVELDAAGAATAAPQPPPMAEPVPAAAATPAPAAVPAQQVEQVEPAPTAPRPVVEPAVPAPVPAAQQPRDDSDHAPAPRLAEIIRPRDAEKDVKFVYRVQGTALDGRTTVTVNRERGGPRAPVLAFLCSDPGRCVGQTTATYPPGSYRYRITFRRPGPSKRSPPAFSHDQYLELDAVSGTTYLIDVRYDADNDDGCTSEISEVAEE